jgi:hypothetical protein
VPCRGRTRAEPDDRRARTATLRRGVEEVLDEILIPQPSHDLRPAHAAPFPVDYPDLTETALRRLAQVLLQGGEDVLGMEGVEVEGILDGDAMHGTENR